MSTQNTTAYIPTPIGVKPKKEGNYAVMMDGDPSYMPRAAYSKKGWAYPTYEPFTHWLRPVDLSRMLEETWDAAIAHHEQEERSPGLVGPRNPKPNKHQFLQSILNPK